MPAPRLTFVGDSKEVKFDIPKHVYEQLEEFHQREGRSNFTDSMRDLLSKGLKTYWLTESDVHAARQGSISNEHH